MSHRTYHCRFPIVAIVTDSNERARLKKRGFVKQRVDQMEPRYYRLIKTMEPGYYSFQSHPAGYLESITMPNVSRVPVQELNALFEEVGSL